MKTIHTTRKKITQHQKHRKGWFAPSVMSRHIFLGANAATGLLANVDCGSVLPDFGGKKGFRNLYFVPVS